MQLTEKKRTKKSGNATATHAIVCKKRGSTGELPGGQCVPLDGKMILP